MTNDEKIQSQLAGMLEIASKNRLEETILNLAEWELTVMDYTSLQEYYVEAKIEYYHNNPEGLQDMLQYMKECTDPDTVFNWDVEKKDELLNQTISISDLELILQADEEFREIARKQDNEDV